MKILLTLALLLTTGAALAQERAAGGTLETQMTWSALSSQIGGLAMQVSGTSARMDQVVICGKKGMLYAPGHTDSKGVIDSDGNGCLGVAGGGAAPTNYCYATYAERWQTPHCEKDYYIKAANKATDNDWDGYAAICCYVKSGTDPRVEADKAGFVTKAGKIGPKSNVNRVVASTIGLSYNAIISACVAKPSLLGQNNSTCPPVDVLP